MADPQTKTQTDPPSPPRSRGDLIDIALNPERPRVSFSGQIYEVRVPGDLTVMGNYRWDRLAGPLQNLLGRVERGEELTPEQDDELGGHLDAACRLLLIAPEDLHAQLGVRHRLAVLEAFIPLLSSRRQTAGATARAGRSRGANSSRASSGSTAETLSPGSKTSRSGSSRRTRG